MGVESLPASTYSILVFVGIISMLCFMLAIYLHKLDKTENEKCKVEFFQDMINRSDSLYSLSMTINDRLCSDGVSDIIFRLRGTFRDSPLILFRDPTGKKFSIHSPVNIGVALPFNLGDLVEVDISCDNDCCEENEPVMCISDVYVRELPRWILPGYGEDPGISWKKRATSALFNTCSEDILAWVCLETVTNSAGAGIIGIAQNRNGKTHTLRAREVCLSLPLTKESEMTKKRAKISYKSLHYIFSMLPRWHDVWSDFSALDQLLVMFLDLVTGMVIISAVYAFALEGYFGTSQVNASLMASLPDVSFTSLEEFDLHTFVAGASQKWFLQNSLNLVHIVWVGCVATLFTLPLSLLWCRLYRFIGGKGFDCCSVKSMNRFREPIPTKRMSKDALDESTDLKAINSSLMLRTLECRSVHTDTSVSSSRRLRIEPMISNCPPDHITARSIAYVRTKMAKLREDDFSMTGLSEPKVAKVLHESHTQSTDAPQMPPPSAGPDGDGEVLGVARYCQRLVQQAPQHIRDRSVIAECYEVTKEKPCTEDEFPEESKRICCPQECNKKNKRCRQQSFSNTTFFTEEDAASVKDLISNFSLQDVAYGSNHKLYSPTARRTQHFVRNAIELPDEHDSEQDSQIVSMLPVPSAGILKNGKSKSSRSKETKNSGTETRTLRNSGCPYTKTEQKQQTTVGFAAGPSVSSESRQRKISSPTIMIGRERSDNPETGATGKKVRYRLHDVMSHRCSQHRKSKKGAANHTAPMPSGYSVNAVADDPLKEADKTWLGDDVVVPFRRRRSVPWKGPRFKLLSFFLLAVVQLLELYFVTAYEDKTRNHFHIPIPQSPGLPPEPGRMHAALLSCIISVLFYLLLTVHLIAFVSFLLELLVYRWMVNNFNAHVYPDYDEQYTYSVV